MENVDFAPRGSGTDGDSSANKGALTDHSLTIHERYENLLGVVKRAWPSSCRDKGDRIYGSHVVDFIGEDKPWGSLGRVAIQRFRLDAPCVYFIGGSVGAIKIGTTIAPLERLATFQLGSPIELRILALTQGGRREESAFHRMFAEKHSHGEWYHRCREIEQVIDDLYFPNPCLTPTGEAG